MEPKVKTPRDLLISGQQYVVPDFQRPFSWGPEELGDFWRDFQPVLDESQDDLFLGAIVLEREQNSPKRLNIWDGQQRLACLVSILAVCRDRLLASAIQDDKVLGGQVQNYIIGDAFAPQTAPVLTLGDLDEKTFHHFVILEYGNADKKDLTFWHALPAAQRRSDWSPMVVDALAITQGHIDKFAQDQAALFGSQGKAIKHLISRLMNKITLISVETSSGADAFRTFMTMNDRGLDLSAADLIKNFLLSTFPSGSPLRLQKKDEWEAMTKTLGLDRLTTFIRHYYMSRYGRTTKSDLYDRVVKLCSSASSPVAVQPQQLISSMADAADLYMRLVEPSGGGWSDVRLKDSLANLATIRSIQWTPVLLAAHAAGLRESELGIIARHIEVLFIRSVTVGGKNPNSFERLFADEANKLWEACGTNPAQRTGALSSLLAELKRNIPPDNVVDQQFQELNELSKSTTKFLLEAIEKHLQVVTHGGALPNIQVLDIEHIYPSSDGPGWPNPPAPGASSAQGYVDGRERERLGNLTLLHFHPNRSQRNAAFSQKVQRYATSPLVITNQITQWTTWDLAAILDRQKRLAQHAIQTWAIPP